MRLIKIKDPDAVEMKPTVDDILSMAPQKVIGKLTGFETLDDDQQMEMLDSYESNIKEKIWIKEHKPEPVEQREGEAEIPQDNNDDMNDETCSTAGSTADTVTSKGTKDGGITSDQVKT